MVIPTRKQDRWILSQKLKSSYLSNRPYQKYNKPIQFTALDDEGNIVPTDPHQFYLWLGPIIHPLTKETVPSYTSYQLKGWKIQLETDLLVVKSNKVGYSSSSLDALIQNCLLKKTAGYEKLIVCQTSQLAKEHLYTIRKRLIDSDNGAQFLIMDIKDKDYLIAGEVTKVTELYIENPYNPTDPSRIFGIGASAGSVVSWKRVNYALASDITKSKTDYRPVLDGLITRLANTRGRLHIETIPNGPVGKVYELYEQIRSGEITKDEMELMIITADDAVKEGVITQAYLDKEKKRLGVMYDQYFNADFIVGHGNVFRPDDIKFCFEQYQPTTINHGCPIIMGLDPGWGSSKFGLCVVQLEDGIVKVMEAQEHVRPQYQSMLNLIGELRYHYRPNKIFVDASQPEFIKSLKVQCRETPDYEPLMEQARKEKVDHAYKMYVVPTSFTEKGIEMLGTFQHFVSNHWFSVSSKDHNELIKQMSTAKFKENANLDKTEAGEETYDLFDAARLTFMNFSVKE